MYGSQGYRAFTQTDDRSHVEAIASGAEPGAVVAQIKRNAKTAQIQSEESVAAAMAGNATRSLGMEGLRSGRIAQERRKFASVFGEADTFKAKALREAHSRFGMPADHAALAAVEGYVTKRMAERSTALAALEGVERQARAQSLAENKAQIQTATTRRLAEANVAAALVALGEPASVGRVVTIVAALGAEQAAKLSGDDAIRFVTRAMVA